MTLLPDRRLEQVAPAFQRKGRIQVGADADIVVFDPETITDRSTYREPLQASEGVRHLLVGGVLVVQEGEFQEQARPGQLVTGVMDGPLQDRPCGSVKSSSGPFGRRCGGRLP